MDPGDNRPLRPVFTRLPGTQSRRGGGLTETSTVGENFEMTDEAYKAFVLEQLKDWLNGLITDHELVNKLVGGTPQQWLLQ